MTYTKADSLRGLKHKDRLKKGQHARKYIRAKGRIGNLWAPFQQKALKAWFDAAVAGGQAPLAMPSGHEVVTVFRKHVENEPDWGLIGRRTNAFGGEDFKGFGIEVGHRLGCNVSRHPEFRHDFDKAEPQSWRYNRLYEPTHRTKSTEEDGA
jgi:hypothetical protein